MVVCALWFTAVSVAAAAPVEVRLGDLILAFDADTGHWLSLRVGDRGHNLLGGDADDDLSLRLEGAEWPETWADASVSEPRDGSVTVTRTAPGWSVSLDYRVEPDSTVLSRRVRATWLGEGRVRIWGATLRIPGATLGGARDAEWFLPGNYPVRHGPLAAGRAGTNHREQGWTWSDTGVAYVRSAEEGLSLVTAYSLEEDHAVVGVEEGAGSSSLTHEFQAAAWLDPGQSIEFGAQWVRVVDRDGTLRDACRDLAARANPGPPVDRPEWLRGVVIEELHPWGRLESWGAGDRGNRMPSIEAQLTHLSELGVDAVWLLPVSEKPPWVYHLPQFRYIDPDVTTPDQLRRFIAAGHDLGVRTLMDLVTYGIAPESPDVATLPDSVWCRDPDGNLQKAWGGTVLAADCSDPDWRAHTVGLCDYWVREFGCDGFRLDCGGSGQVPNWRPRSGARANSAMLAGGVGQNRLIRDAIRARSPDAVLLPEAGATCNFPSADLLFDYPFYMVCRELTREPDAAAWVGRAREWLGAQGLTHTKLQRESLVRFLENHDTVAAQDYFGVGPSQALTALITFLPGALLLHQEEEVGFSTELREWLRLRREHPALRDGDADFELLAASDPRVLAFLRYTDSSACLVAVSFSPEPVGCTFGPTPAAEAGLRAGVPGLGGFSGVHVTIPPYRPYVLDLTSAEPLLSSDDSDARPAEPRPCEPDEIAAEATERGSVRYTVEVANASRWCVGAAEGLLSDVFVDRHRSAREGETHVDATPPLARCWRPMEHGLWDAPGPRLLALERADGSVVAIEVEDLARCMDARIEGDAAGVSARLAVEAHEGAAPFRAQEFDSVKHLRSYLASIAPKPPPGPVRTDPLWVTLSNAHCTAVISRRHGGTLWSLRSAADPTRELISPSEAYTDWGLYEQGRHISTEGETNPRLSIESAGAETRVTFTGTLRTPSWNGVQTAGPAGPEIAYRITYAIGEGPALQVEIGVTPTADRPDTQAFLAYRLPFVGVESWAVQGAPAQVEGVPGAASGTRVFEALTREAQAGAFALRAPETAVTASGFDGAPAPPQNPFLLDDGPGRMQLFFALLNGQAVALEAGRERMGRFELRVEPR